MKAESSTCRLSILFAVLFISLTTGELEFYQDVEPGPPEDPSFKTFKRFLELENQHEVPHSRVLHQPYPITYTNYLPKYSTDKQRTIFDILMERQRILEILQKNKFRNFNYQQRTEYHAPNEYPRSLVEHDRSYVNLESPSKSYEYPKVNIPYPVNSVNERMYFSHGSHGPARIGYPNWKNFEDNMADNTLTRMQDEILDPHSSKSSNTMNIDSIPNLSQKWNGPEFTYRFDVPSINVRDAFAMKPNDPRYHDDQISSNHRTNEQTLLDNDYSHTTEGQNEKEATDSDNSIIMSNLNERDTMHNKFAKFHGMMPEPQRRTDEDTVIATSTDYQLGNDAYFIAIVAGGSAAAMFVLILISLTWCRMQRGVKAAADIDYPAYGVTGPNKDVSPSGDQRLAHSAQMYHFQHQKQQIIAMEKSTAAREPGSVSEAESDEENEEGDYTVYECPGLAPAGEMEVKNPLFHDDPTPTTPSQKFKDMDHSKQ